MKRLFSNKSGFSLAEIIVAIAVFAVMMAMIMQMLQLSVAQRSANYAFAKDLQQQEEALVVNGKDTTFPEDGSGVAADPLTLQFMDPKDPTKPLFTDSEGNEGLSMNYAVKGTKEDDADYGLNYFIGDYDYSADGVGGSGGDGSGGGVGQTAQYDTRISGTKGLKNIQVTLNRLIKKDESGTLPDGTSVGSGQTAYKMTVKADSSAMQSDDKRYSQMRFYFYSIEEYSDKKVEKWGKVTDEAGNEVDGVVDTYYKRVYDTAEIVKVIPDSGNAYTVEQSSSYAVRIGLPLGGWNNNDGFSSSTETTFYIVFKGDPGNDLTGLKGTDFGNGSSSTYNRSPVYDEKTGADTGKKHVNIYGSYPFETCKTADGEFKVGGAK